MRQDWRFDKGMRAATQDCGPYFIYSCSLRCFLRLRLRASASFTRFFSPGFK